MAFKNNNNDDNPQNTKHCVLIDGDFGRHELFSNIHPYTLNRLAKLNDAFTFKTYTEKALKLMNDASNIHYHICYNSSLLEIDEYYKILKMVYPQSVWLHSSINTTTDNTLQIKEIISRHECDYIWIIHGIENHYEQLIERLKSNNNLKANISSYCWLENLKDGSNRIEYLVNNKIKYQTEDQIERLSIQPILTESITITTKPTEQNKKSKTKIKCDFDGCEKQFTTLKALKSHQNIADHLITHSVENEETTTTTLVFTTDKPKKAGKTKKVVCDFDGCGKPFKNLNRLKKHQLAAHPSTHSVINEETPSPASTTEKPKKRVKKTKVVCDFNGCGKRLKNLDALKSHQLAKHSGDQPVINEEITTSASTTEKSKKAAKKSKMECGFDDCRLSFKKRRLLQKHRIETHPIPLRCLFSEECLGSHERYLGILSLQNHIILQHTDSFRERICPINGCKSPKLWHDWSAALNHILQRHTKYLLGGITSYIQTIPATDVPSWDLGGPFKCAYNDSDRLYWEEEALRRHEVFEHPVILLCPFCSECQQSPKKYMGLWNLRRHVISMHAPMFSQPTCFDFECKCEEEKPFENWNQVLRHILVKHLEAVGVIDESTTSSLTTKSKIYKKCSYDTCNQLFKTRDKFLYHLVIDHPYPLRCPYDSECNNIASGKVYLGLMKLERHIKTDHSVQFSEPMCFDGKCQQEKHYQDWDTVVDHILKKHLLDIK